MGRPQPDHAAPRCGDPYRSPHVGPESQLHVAGGKRGRAAARRSAGRMRRLAGIAHGDEGAVVRRGPRFRRRRMPIVLPATVAPASSRRATAVASISGMYPSSSGPTSIGMPATQMMSLMPARMPESGPDGAPLTLRAPVPGIERILRARRTGFPRGRGNRDGRAGRYSSDSIARARVQGRLQQPAVCVRFRSVEGEAELPRVFPDLLPRWARRWIRTTCG